MGVNLDIPVKDSVLKAIQFYLPLGTKPSMTSTEIDYICGLQEPYRELACLQAVEGQLIRMGRTQEALIAKEQIRKLGDQIAAEEVQAYKEKQAWVSEYGDYHYGSIKKPKEKLKAILEPEPTDVAWEAADCELCSDTGWIVNFNTLNKSKMKVPCSCAKGTEKAKNKIIVDTPVFNIPAFNKIKEEQELSNKKQQLKHELAEQKKNLAEVKSAIESEKSKLKAKRHWYSVGVNKEKEAEIAILETQAGMLEAQIAITQSALVGNSPYGAAQAKQQAALNQLNAQQVYAQAQAEAQQAAVISTMVTPPAPKGPPELPSKGRKFR